VFHFLTNPEDRERSPKSIRVATVASGRDWHYRVDFPANREPHEWTRDDLESFACAMVRCIEDCNQQSDRSGWIWEIRRVPNLGYIMSVYGSNWAGPEAQTLDHLSLSHLVPAHDPSGTAGELVFGASDAAKGNDLTIRLIPLPHY
jgi:hypothetical protein